jgi:hypothetical protein
MERQASEIAASRGGALVGARVGGAPGAVVGAGAAPTLDLILERVQAPRVGKV